MGSPCGGNATTFSNDPASSSTLIRALDVTQLQTAINDERGRRGLGGTSWTSVAATDVIDDLHYDELFNVTDYIDDNPGGGCTHSNLSWSYNPKNTGDIILANTVNELRDNIQSLEVECVCNCNHACTCNCNHACTCNCNYSCTCNCNYSDEELKENIVPITNALDIISDIKGVAFDWKDTSFGSGKNLGVLAQDIEKVLPELVVEREHGKAVYYQQLIPVLIEAIKELQNKVKKLEEM